MVRAGAAGNFRWFLSLRQRDVDRAKVFVQSTDARASMAARSDGNSEHTSEKESRRMPFENIGRSIGRAFFGKEEAGRQRTSDVRWSIVPLDTRTPYGEVSKRARG